MIDKDEVAASVIATPHLHVIENAPLHERILQLHRIDKSSITLSEQLRGGGAGLPRQTAVLLMLLSELVALGCVQPRSRPQSFWAVTVAEVAKYSVRAASAPVMPEVPSAVQ